MTQATATPELVERLKDAAERFLKWTYDQPYSGSPVISIPRHPNNIDTILCEAADALEAQQARIAELEDENEQLRLAICGVGPSDLTDPRSQHSDGGHDV